MKLLRRLLGAWHWSAFRVAWSLPLVAFGTWGLVTALRLDATLGAFFVLACGLAGLLGPDRGARAWRALAHEHSLTFFPRSLTRGRSVAGTIGDQRVTLLEDPLKRDRATLVVSQDIPEGFTLHLRSLLSTIAASHVRTGDFAFDEAIVLRGDAAAALAAIGDPAHRKTLRRLLEPKPEVEVSRGAVRMTLTPGPDGSRIEAALALAREIASTLSCGATDDGVARALSTAVRHDHEPEFQRECLAALAARFPDRDETEVAKRAAREDRFDKLALDAAKLLGDESLKQFAREKRHDPQLAMNAIEKIAEPLDDATRLELVGCALKSPLPGAMRHADPIPAIAALQQFDRLKDGTLAAPSLIAALENPDEPVRELAADALKWVGGSDAIEALKRVVERNPNGKDAKAALAAMRALGEGREGELSLGEPVQDGSLSLAGSGELSVSKRVRSGRKVTS